MKPNLLIILCIILFAGCGPSAIDQAQGFKPNKPPVLDTDAFRITLPDGSAVPESMRTKLTNGMSFKVWARAEDPENGSLNYAFDAVTNGSAIETGKATFGAVTPEPGQANGTVSALFTLTGLSGANTAIAITVKVSDTRKGSVKSSMDLGTLKSGPVISIASAPKAWINNPGSTSLTFTVNSNGFYQLIPVNHGDSAPGSDEMRPFYRYHADTETTITIAGSTYPGTSQVELAATEQEWDIHLVFTDNINPDVADAVTVGVDNTPPTLAFKSDTTPMIDNTRISSTAVIRAEGSDARGLETISLNPASTALIAGEYTASYADNALTITPAYDFKTGSGTFVATASDIAGNTTTLTRTLNMVRFDYYVASTGSDANPGTRTAPKATIQNAVDAADGGINDGETATIHIAEGTYAVGAGSSILNISFMPLKNIVVRGGYYDSWNRRNPWTNPTRVSSFFNSDCKAMITLNDTGRATIIDGLTLQPTVLGNLSGFTVYYFYLNPSHAEITNCTFIQPVMSGTAGACVGIQALEGTPAINNNRITLGNRISNTRGIVITNNFVETPQPLLIQNNIICTGGPTIDGAAIEYNNTCSSGMFTTIMRGNILDAGWNDTSTRHHGIVMNSSGAHSDHIRIDNNIFTARAANFSSNSDNACIWINSSSDSTAPTSIHNNLFTKGYSKPGTFYLHQNYFYNGFYRRYNSGTDPSSDLILTDSQFGSFHATVFLNNSYYYRSDHKEWSMFNGVSDSPATFDYTLNTANPAYALIDGKGLNGYEARAADTTWDYFPRNAEGKFCDILGNARPETGGWNVGAYE